VVSDEFCLDKVNILGWLSYKKGDILHTNGVPIKGEASCFKSKVHKAVSHSTTFQTQSMAVMVFMLQMMLHKLVVVCTNLLISINCTSPKDLLFSCHDG